MNSGASTARPASAAPEGEVEPGEQTDRPLPFVLGIVGDSGSGKSTICQGVQTLIGAERVTNVKLDDYLRFSRSDRMERGLTALNPAVHDLSLMQEHLQLLRNRRSIRNRAYEHADGTFGPLQTLEARDVILVRGLLGFPTDELRAAYDLAVFLYPEPDLLFRWKLRRDVRTRGYSEADVLKYIAQHLLDAKEFVHPQAEKADMVVRYEVPEWEAPDSEVCTTLTLRRTAAEALQNAIASLDRFGDVIRVHREGDDVVLRLGNDLPQAEVDAWARERFPTYDPDVVGGFQEAGGGHGVRPQLAFIEVLIARLTQKLRRVDDRKD